MHRKPNSNREAGLTLVEILASLVILGIVFVAFMTIFPQMTLFNSRTETKLETMNEARIVLDRLKDTKIKGADWGMTTCSKADETKDEWVTYSDKQNDRGETITIDFRKCPDVVPQNKNAPGVVQLHQARILIKDKSKVMSKSFGYVEVK